MTIEISDDNQVRLAEEARRRGMSVDSYLEQLLNERATPAASGLTGAALLAVLQASPYRDIDLTPPRERLPVRDVVL